MADIDLTSMSVTELQDLINRASDAKYHAEHLAQDEAAARKIRIKQAATELEALLGPENATPGTGSIRAVLAYGEEIISANPGQAVFLAITGMSILTDTVMDIAKTISE